MVTEFVRIEASVREVFADLLDTLHDDKTMDEKIAMVRALHVKEEEATTKMRIKEWQEQ